MREIHRRISLPEPPDVIARALRVSPSTVYRHKQGDCSCPEGAANGRTSKRLRDQWARELSALGVPDTAWKLETMEGLMLRFPDCGHWVSTTCGATAVFFAKSHRETCTVGVKS